MDTQRATIRMSICFSKPEKERDEAPIPPRGFGLQEPKMERYKAAIPPMGYRFAPTDEELVMHYLSNKVFNRPLPAKIIPEISASEFYSKPPNNLAKSRRERVWEWFFFVYRDGEYIGQMDRFRVIDDGVGFWRSAGGEEPIYNSEGDVLASKIHFTYFSGSQKFCKRTHWRMEEYRLRTNSEDQEWVIVKMIQGKNNTRDCLV